MRAPSRVSACLPISLRRFFSAWSVSSGAFQPARALTLISPNTTDDDDGDDDDGDDEDDENDDGEPQLFCNFDSILLILEVYVGSIDNAEAGVEW